MSNDNNEGFHSFERNEGESAEDFARQFIPPSLAAIMEGSHRGVLTDVANDYDLFLREIQASLALLSPAIGYVSYVMTSIRQRTVDLLSPVGDPVLSDLMAPSVVGFEEHGVEGCMQNGTANELLDLSLLSALAAVRGVVLTRIRKFCSVADMLEQCSKTGGGPEVEFARRALQSIDRILRMLDAIGVTFSDRDQGRFDLAQAAEKIKAYIIARSK